MTTDHESATPHERHQQQAWLEQRIVQIEVFCYEVDSFRAQIKAIDLENIHLGKEFHRSSEREELREQWAACCQEMHERCPELPYPGLSVQHHLDTYCATLLDMTGGRDSTTMTTPDPRTTQISDQQLKTILEERIVQLVLAEYELHQIHEQLVDTNQYLEFLVNQTASVPLPQAEVERRDALERALRSREEAIQAAFTPSASQPFSVQEELHLTCQTLLEVNERLKAQEHQEERAVATGKPEHVHGPPLTREEQHQIERYNQMAADLKSYREYGVEMEKIRAQMDTHGKNTKIGGQLHKQLAMFRVAQETYLTKMLATYQVADLSAIQEEMRAIEPLILQAYQQREHFRHLPGSMTSSIEEAYATLQKEHAATRTKLTGSDSDSNSSPGTPEQEQAISFEERVQERLKRINKPPPRERDQGRER